MVGEMLPPSCGGRWRPWVWVSVSCRWPFLRFSTSASPSAIRHTSRANMRMRTQKTQAAMVGRQRGGRHKVLQKKRERGHAVEPRQMSRRLPLPKYNYHETLENDWGVFFWRPPGFMCNWTSSPFVYAAVDYLNAEQAIMHQKALLFGDHTVAEQIMHTTDPRQQKAFGRQVSSFDHKTWERTIPDLLFAILLAKFSQNESFGCALLETGHKQLFESSPKDLIWGTGVSPQQAVLCGREEARQWRGQNLLGKTLMKVRDALAGTIEQSRTSRNTAKLPSK